MAHDDAARMERLLELLAPIHEGARTAARRMARSNADGDDLFQETVLRALDRIRDVREPERFRGWFYAVMLNVHRARHRRRFWRRLLPLQDAGALPAPDTGDGGGDAVEGADRMARALATLPPEQREAIVLFELQGFTLEEVAAAQRTSLSAVKSRLARARERLRRHYQRTERAFGSVAKEWT